MCGFPNSDADTWPIFARGWQMWEGKTDGNRRENNLRVPSHPLGTRRKRGCSL